ncbi:MAG: response regulator [Candidatus Latescibacterota bacterium]|nr:MAG: response regulator [Candidatus Latescibacterota bacterium]
MGNKLDSTSLFLAQVNQHAEALGRLISTATSDEVDDTLMERCIVGTSMLANSASIMELEEWRASLESFNTLLVTYRDNKLPWDEKIAQITSEFIEREDRLVATAGEGGAMDFAEVVCPEELEAISKEVSELLGCPTDAPTTSEETQVETTGRDIDEMSAPSDAPPRTAPQAEPDDRVPAQDVPHDRTVLGDCLKELRKHAEALTGAGSSKDERLDNLSDSRLEAIRRELCLIDFYALSMEDVIARLADRKPLVLSDLAPIRFAIADFARELCSGTRRRVTVELAGEDNTIDVRLLHPVQRVLRHLIGDIFSRCEEPELGITVTVENQIGALRWKLRDNGTNFIHDSRFDPDEYLAFYPGLRDARKVLAELRSLLWVEPDENGDTRFAFTTPLSVEGGEFTVWKNDGHSVAVLPNQFSDIFLVGDVNVGDDTRGEYITIDGRRVPVLRLGHVYSGAPIDGDRIAVVGFLEKRIGFYVRGEQDLQSGMWRKEAVSVWRGMEKGMVEIEGKRVPLVDANGLLKRYMAIVDVMTEGDASGGVGDDVTEADRSPVHEKTTSDVSSDGLSFGEEETDVLVVEQNEALRATMESILSGEQIRTKIVDRLETALDFVRRGRTSLIISDFRVPSMAAKVLVDRLEREGKHIPVLVTTSHRGENAELLVEQLGVAGYLSKPLRPDDVLARVGEFLESSRVRAPKS